MRRRHEKLTIDRSQQAAVAPDEEIALHRRRRRDVIGQHRPLATRRSHIQDRTREPIQNVARAGGPRPADRLQRRQQRRHRRPFPVRRFGSIVSARPLIWRRMVSVQGIVMLVQRGNRTQSQPAGTTPLFSGQALTHGPPAVWGSTTTTSQEYTPPKHAAKPRDAVDARVARPVYCFARIELGLVRDDRVCSGRSSEARNL